MVNALLLAQTSTINWATLGALAGTVAALVSVPLGAAAQYLRQMVQLQSRQQESANRRMDRIERQLSEVHRDYQTKEDSLRQVMSLRKQIDRLNDAVLRIEGGLDAANGLGAGLAQVAQTLVEHDRNLARQLAGAQQGAPRHG
jgi:hypothetical protein